MEDVEKENPDNRIPQEGGREESKGMWTKPKPAAGCVRNNNNLCALSFNSIRSSECDTTDPTVHVTRNNNLK